MQNVRPDPIAPLIAPLALQQAGLDIPDQPTAKRDLNKIQQTFNDWAKETALPYTHLGKIAAYSVGVNYESQLIQQESSKFKAVIG
ncbi:hypothetical protein ACFQNF_06555 [Iodobacter arcticus]|uniref:Uncharacterized protein n=1 Tax=Iodobacter arcticus TaxID=590593 RepID=A0ABW2QUY4_9NEIS